jgi:CO dehydrogenase maturation factor
MKIAVTGKGGVGKTTLTSLLAYSLVDLGYQVLAIDADPSPCLGAAMGFPQALLAKLTPVARMEELIYERTGAQPGTIGGFFKLNPRVEDIPDRFSVEHEGIRLLEMGAVEMGGAGCICPESAILRALTTHILLQRDEVVLMDMYAGVEHLGRATADSVDAMLIVVEPTARSLATAKQIKTMRNSSRITPPTCPSWVISQRMPVCVSLTARGLPFTQSHPNSPRLLELLWRNCVKELELPPSPLAIHKS